MANQEIKNEILWHINNCRTEAIKEYKRRNTNLERINYLNGIQTGMELTAKMLGIRLFWNTETSQYEAA